MRNEDIKQNDQENINKVLIGTFLKDYREKCGLSIEKISKETKISTSLLILLENNQLDELPNKTYITGFVKSYAKLINADQKECIKILNQTYKVINPQQKTKKKRTTSQSNRMPTSIIILALLTVAAITYYISQAYIKTNSENNTANTVITPQVLTSSSPLKTASIQQNSEKTLISNSQETNLEASQDEIKTETVVAATPPPTPISKKKEVTTIEDKNKQTNTTIPKATPVSVLKPSTESKRQETKAIVTEVKEQEQEQEQEQEEEEIIKIALKSITDVMYSINPTPSKELEELLPKRIKSKATSGNQNLFITASHDETWITYKKDDNPIRQFLLKKNENTFISGKSIRVFIGRVDATDIFLNNKHLIVPATKKNGVKSLVFPKKDKNKYKRPLFIHQKNKPVITSDEYEAAVNKTNQD